MDKAFYVRRPITGRATWGRKGFDTLERAAGRRKGHEGRDILQFCTKRYSFTHARSLDVQKKLRPIDDANHFRNVRASITNEMRTVYTYSSSSSVMTSLANGWLLWPVAVLGRSCGQTAQRWLFSLRRCTSGATTIPVPAR